MSDYTPGPWALREDCCVIVDSVVGYPIAGTRTKRSEEENIANAHLISAAPDLLGALEALVKQQDEWNTAVALITGRQGNWSDGYLSAARAAIAKARGQ